MSIKGIEGLSYAALEQELASGGRFVVFEYVVSVLIMSFKRSSDIHFIRAGEGTFGKGLPYTLVALLLGWWGFPWGLIWTPMALVTNFGGGRDVTDAVLATFERPLRRAA